MFRFEAGERALSALRSAPTDAPRGGIAGIRRNALGAAITAAVLLITHNALAADALDGVEKKTSQKATTLPAILVKGQADSEATDGTHAYAPGKTTAATRLPLSLRETPQSVTVVTRQRMDDQQLNSVQSVLDHTTGIASYQSDSERTSFYCRGFLISNLQYDGIPTVVGDIVNGSGIGALDTAFYDRVEVVRGASGLLTGTGNPSAAINLVRKRPTRDFSASASLGAGSWDTYRGMADVSTPLTQDGRIRARVVGTYQDGDSYINRYKPKRKSFYGIIEADLTADTTVSLGLDYQDITPKGATWGGMPLWFSDGTQAEYPRSSSYAQDWSHWDNTRKTGFAEIEHRFVNGWNLRAVANQYRTDYDAELLGLVGRPDRATGLGSYPDGAFPVALASRGRSRQNTFDVMAGGHFELLGREHELVVGATTSRRTASQQDIAPFYAGFMPVNVYDLSQPYPRPDFAAIGWRLTGTRIKQRGVYGAARFSLADPLKLIVGGRFSDYEIDDNASGNPLHYKKTGEFTPYAGLIYDIDHTYSAYVSYTGIFNPQTDYRDSKGNVLTPSKGRTREIGLKGVYLDGRLNASLALFDTALDNSAQILAGTYTPGGAQAYEGADGTKSRGIELDLQGELGPGWNISAGIAHFTAHDGDDVRLNSQLPRTTAQLFTTYQLPGTWSRLALGGGVKWQSRIYEAPNVGTSSLGGEQGAYALASLMGRYAIARKTTLGVNLENVFDRKYALQKGDFDTVTYGAPRSVMVTLDYRY
ncbi:MULTISPECIES: TonB-dependent siderophore receptor [Pseudoxanthomonas]|uniref:Outer membrane receptor for ferric coprogen and ferric-rhodotorulic acid n=1 Tax=Pseudoxanthomonas winnipegensis TaxID=2480810 RepID=A0AAW8GD07_9GAMM|nr:MULTISPECIES: TonB-dependent siderophore receptor [Pseudoxanthomonas]MDQ1119043.1 outer membrane receptor for ferric coprogen and ferric-rhodotorulic acid [Pseudoxanthomonas winnipegensis]MDQ1132231.1 outer membrane receptor for ferric coprogen and ferric-rhodotorulic acid [Pseudoxanthomonas winnipegensis]MDR6137754.1 outer membrane receptor for ferric coprogen and ferric-rhodotorulic acid [Pseudoxanthomonas sp. SORGH_AS_0997]